MNYEEAMNFIQNTNKFGSVLGLDNIRELLERLGNPQDQLRVVHIAGTNGKGSTLAFLAGIFRESGYPLHPFPMKKGFVSMKKIFLKKTCAFIWKK